MVPRVEAPQVGEKSPSSDLCGLGLLVTVTVTVGDVGGRMTCAGGETMDQFSVDEGALDTLASTLTGLAVAVDEAMIAHDAAREGSLPVVQRSHSALVERWQLGLSTARGALDELSGSVAACATSYRLTDDDQAVEFQGAIT